MSEFDYKKWLREQKDSLEPEDMPEKPEGDLDGDGKVDSDEIKIKKDFESILAKELKEYFDRGELGTINKKAFIDSVRRVKDSSYYIGMLERALLRDEYKPLLIIYPFLESVIDVYYEKYILSNNIKHSKEQLANDFLKFTNYRISNDQELISMFDEIESDFQG